jgi:hypothetical protein
MPQGFHIKVETRDEGWHPSEAMVTFTDAQGAKQCVFLNKGSVSSDMAIPVTPVERGEDGAVLVQLPREAMSGAWRVWMPETALLST